MDNNTGLKKPIGEISVNTDPAKVSKFGVVSRADSLSGGLLLKQIGAPGHYEIIPSYAMSMKSYQALLDRIVYTVIQ